MSQLASGCRERKRRNRPLQDLQKQFRGGSRMPQKASYDLADHAANKQRCFASLVVICITQAGRFGALGLKVGRL